MANWTNIKKSVSDAIKTNDSQQITGQKLQSTLLSIIDTIGENATFAGIAGVSTNPGLPDGPVFYIAVDTGTYSNFAGINVQGLSILEWDGTNWTKKELGIPTKLGMRSKSNIAFLSCNYHTHISIEGNTVTFDKQGWDIYAENFFFRADGALNDSQTITLYNGSGFIYFDIEKRSVFASGDQKDINSNSLLIGLNRFNEVTLFATRYTDNGVPKGLYNTPSANTPFDKSSSTIPVSHKTLFDSFYKNSIAVNRGKVSWERNVVQLGAGSYYFYNQIDGSYRAVTLNDTVTFSLSSTDTCLVFNRESREFEVKSESLLSAEDVICLFYDGAEGMCGGLWYARESIKKLEDAADSPNGALGLRYTLGLSQVVEQLVYTEMFPATAGDVIKWTSYIEKTSISMEELNSNKTVIDRWTAPSNTRTATLTRSDTAYVRAVFSYTEESSAYDQSLYVNNSLKAKLSAEVKNEYAGVAYFNNANIEVDASTRKVVVKQGSDIYAAVKDSNVFYRFPNDYSFDLDSGGTNFLIYDYKKHTISSTDKMPTNACVIGVKNGYKVYFNGIVSISYSDGDNVKLPISANQIKELTAGAGSVPSFVDTESKTTYKRVIDYLSDQTGFLLAQITDVHSGNSERFKHVGYLNSLNMVWGFNVLCNGGDIGLDVGETENEALNLMYNTKAQMNCTSPWLFCKGNHERLRTRKEIGAIFMKPAKRQFSQIQFGDSTGLYGYIDDNNTRVIYLNTSDTDSEASYAVSDAQVAWLGNTLYSTPSNYKVVILTHLCPKPIGEWIDYPGDWRTAENLTKVIEAFAQKTSASHAGETWNFAGSTAKLVCVLSGDSHFNNSLRENGVNYFVRQGYGGISESSMPEGATYDSFNPSSQCLFDVLVIKDNSNAKIFRIGAGGALRDVAFTF